MGPPAPKKRFSASTLGGIYSSHSPSVASAEPVPGLSAFLDTLVCLYKTFNQVPWLWFAGRAPTHIAAFPL